MPGGRFISVASADEALILLQEHRFTHIVVGGSEATAKLLTKATSSGAKVIGLTGDTQSIGPLFELFRVGFLGKGDLDLMKQIRDWASA